MQPFDAVFALPQAPAAVRQLTFRTDSVFEPSRDGAGSRDVRKLGFALVEAAFQAAP